MKRERYEVSVNGEVIDVRSKWNACIRSIEATVRLRALAENMEYELTSSESIKEGSS